MHLKQSGKVLCVCASALLVVALCALAEKRAQPAADGLSLFRALKLENPEAPEALYASLPEQSSKAC